MKFNRLTLGALAAAAIAGCALTSCNDKETEHKTSDITFDRLKSQAAYTLDNSASAFASDNDLTFGAEVNMVLPTAIYGHDIAAFRDSILRMAFDTVGSDYDAIMQRFENMSAAEVGFKCTPLTVAPDSASFLARYDGYTSVEGNVTTMTPDIMSYQLTLSEYPMRAAHGDYTINYINYDLNNGKVIALEDIFTEDGLKALPKILQQRANTVESVIGPTTLTDLPSGGNFFINNQGNIVFAYQPYEIASYAQGAVQVKLAPYLVSQYLTPYGKALLLN